MTLEAKGTLGWLADVHSVDWQRIPEHLRQSDFEAATDPNYCLAVNLDTPDI